MDVWRILTTLKEPNKDEWKPNAPEDAEYLVEKSIFAEDIKIYIKRKNLYENNCCSLFTIKYGQCSESLQDKLRAQDNWKTIFEKNELFKIMKSIKI